MAVFEYVGGELDIFAGAGAWKRYFASRIKPHIGKKVLEVGAGTGSSTTMLCGEGVRDWLCLDPDPGHAGVLGAKAADGGLPAVCRSMCGTLEDIGREETFDTILYIDVLEHIREDKAEIDRAAGLLAAGGSLIVLSPAHQWLTTAFDRAVGHFRRYSKSSLASLAPEGCRLASLAYLDSAGMLLSLGNRLLLHQDAPTAGQIRFWDRKVVPVSRILDPLFGYSIGKTVLGIWKKP